MTTKTKARRIRVTKEDIAKAHESLLDQSETPRQTTKTVEAQPWGKDYWIGQVYFDSYGWAWGVDKALDTVCLGKAETVLSILKGDKQIEECVPSKARTILLDILEDIKEERDAKSKPREARRPHIERSRPGSRSRHRH